MADAPRVSVVITTYNRAILLPRAVNSVLAQTYPDYEIVIVDDCSTDSTPDVIRSFADTRIRSFKHKQNRGVSAARNTGIANARGEYISFLDDDDEWLPAKLEKQTALLDAALSKVGLVYGWMDVVEDSSEQGEPFDRLNVEGSIFNHMLRLNGCLHSTMLARTSAVRETGGFDENLTAREDTEFMCRLSLKWEAIVLPEVVSLYHRYHGHDQLTHINHYGGWRLEAEFFNHHITRYENELRRDSEGFSFVLRRLALSEMMLGNISASMSAVHRAFKVAPIDTTRAVLFNIPFILSRLVRKLRRRATR